MPALTENAFHCYVQLRRAFSSWARSHASSLSAKQARAGPSLKALAAGKARSTPLRACLIGFCFSTLLSLACGGPGATATPTATSFPTTAPTASPTPTPSPTSTLRVEPTLAPTPTPTPVPTSTPTHVPTPTPTQPPTPTPQPTQPRELFLQVPFPSDNSITAVRDLIVKGTASPDATVSVNEQIVELDILGQFETTRPLKLEEGPNLIEVIAGDLAGEVRAQVLTIIYTEDEDGLFGRVTGITTPSPGLTIITLDSTTAGEQAVEAAENTTVRIPGRETASAADLSQCDFLAVSGTRIHPGLISATRILVKPSALLVHAHVTGSVVGGTENQLNLMDRHDNVIAADPPPGGGAIEPGQLVTTVVLQDLKTGALSITGIEAADDKMYRLISALEGAALAGAAANEQNLGQRLQASATGYLTTLQEILHRVNADLRFLYTQSFGRSFRSHEDTLSRFGLGAPTIRVAGIIEDIERTRAARRWTD